MVRGHGRWSNLRAQFCPRSRKLAQTIKLFLRSNGEIKVDGSCLSLRHLRDKLAVVFEEELDIDGLGVGLVTEKGNEDLETANEGGW